MAAQPSWWVSGTNQIIISGGTAANYAPANLGQLKFVAKRAKGHLDENLMGGAGASISAMVAGFESGTSPAIIAGNYAPLNIGQLKAVAKPFYDRLIAAGYDTKANLIARGFSSTWAFSYPWNPSTPVSENYAPANLGQLKAVFSFDLTGFDTDHDGLPDAWELAHFGNLSATGSGDADGDGISNAQELAQGTDPTLYDSDGDGMADGWEIANGLNPSADDATGDPDHDGSTNLQEYNAGTVIGKKDNPIVQLQVNVFVQ